MFLKIFSKFIYKLNKLINKKGLLGMGFQGNSVDNTPTPFQNLIAQGQLAQNMFAFYLTR